MNSKFKAAFLAPYPHWLLILIVGIIPTIIVSVLSRDLLVFAVLFSVLLKVLIFGRIFAQALPANDSSFWGLLREHGLNYFIVGILAAILTFVARLVAIHLVPHHYPYLVLTGIMQGGVAIITIYAWPLVFLRRSNVSALLAGVLFLAKNTALSLWILGIVIVGQFIHTAGRLVYLDHRSGWTFGVLLVAGVVFSYLATVAFAAALHTLMGAPKGSNRMKDT